MNTWVYLRDANYQLADSIKVKTNEYGSFSGKFQVPVGYLMEISHLYKRSKRRNRFFS